jgi:hypothetical protein
MIDAGTTDHLHIVFSIEPVENPNKSLKEGRPIYDDREMVEIKFVGDPKKVLVAPAHDKFMKDGQTGEWITYAQAYHRHYEAFKTGQAAKGEGTPIEELHFITASRRAELKALHIHTAEGLAGLEGANLARLGMYGRQLKEQATDYIARSKETALETRLSAENASLKARLEALEAAMAGKPVAPQPESPAAEKSGASTFETWKDEQIKAFIKERTGKAPMGQPSHATLVAAADKIVADEAA